MRLFLDSSVLLAACGSEAGASREIFRRARSNAWTLICTPYVIAEVLRNLSKLRAGATDAWPQLLTQMLVMDDVVTLDRPADFPAVSDRPILFSALAWADILLTLDQGDFAALIGSSIYDLQVLKPGMFLERERAAGTLS